MIKVTAAVIRRGDRVLVCKRPEGKKFGGLFEFPGGKCEHGETLFQCVVRELREELCVTVEPLRCIVTEVSGDYEITFIECALAAGELTLTEHQEIRWITPEDAADMSFCPTDGSVLGKVFDPPPEEVYTVTDLTEPDNGCEGYLPGEEPLVTLTLSGGRRIKVPDRIAYELGWDEGSALTAGDIARCAVSD